MSGTQTECRLGAGVRAEDFTEDTALVTDTCMLSVLPCDCGVLLLGTHRDLSGQSRDIELHLRRRDAQRLLRRLTELLQP
jgi:hypothetical protein